MPIRYGRTKNMRVAAGLFAAVLLALLLCSAAFLIAHADHDCPGEDCGVCAQLAAVVSGFAHTGLALLAAACVCGLAYTLKTSVFAPAGALSAFTLTKSKVRLNI